MKKIIGLLIITMIIGLYCKPITSKANEILEVGVKDIDPYGEFNYFRGISVEEYSGKPESIFYGVFDGLFENGVLSHEVTVKNTENTQFIFKYDYHYNDYHLDVAKVYLDGDLIYEAEFEEENLSKVNLCEKIIVEEITNVKDDYFKIVSYSLFDNVPFYDLDTMEYIGMFLIQGHKYIYNEAYKGKDVYFVTSIENLISFEEIKSKITASDSTDGDLTDKIIIRNNTYDPTDENITIGDYSFDAVVYDSVGNTTYQTCYVKVVDLMAPTIVPSEPIDVEYTQTYSWDYFLTKFTYDDNVGIAKKEVIEDTYTTNYNKPGTYDIKAMVTDTSGNTATAVLKVNVIDKVPPKIEGPSSIQTTTLNPLTSVDLREYFTFTDVIDPEVTRYNIVDEDDYFSNSKKEGTYGFTIEAYDKYDNKGIYYFTLIVRDLDYPSISIDSNFTIVVGKGETITKEEIINFLNDLGMLEQTVVDVTSPCFDEENPAGTYDVSIILDDGSVINNKLIIKEDVSYDAPILASVNSPLLLASGIICFVLVLSFVYFRSLRRRRIRR